MSENDERYSSRNQYYEESLHRSNRADIATPTDLTHRSHTVSFSRSSPSSPSTPSPYHFNWKKVQETLQEELDPQVYQAYIRPLRFLSYQKNHQILSLEAPSRFVKQHVDSHYSSHLQSSCAPHFGHNLTIEYSLPQGDTFSHEERNQSFDPEPHSNYVVVKKVRSKKESKPLAEESGLISRYTFDNFVVGSGNQFCHAAAMHVAESPGADYNPLFIYGGVGLGKTHLLHAIGNAVLAKSPEKQVRYLSSESFTNELISALRYAKMDEFKNRFRNFDVLLIDDIQFICGKERTQEEFFHTFNALYSAKHQIVITSDKLPQEIQGLEERLQTRFSWGLTADIQAPDYETRVAILKRKAAIDRFLLPESVAHLIAENISSNVRELEGALTRLNALCSLQKVEMSRELAESALKPLLKKKKVNVVIEDIQHAVAKYFDIKVSEMVSKRRTKNLSFPRHVAMYLCRKHTTSSYPEIGLKFGGRDHSSVIHAANVVTGKLKESKEIRNHIKTIEEILLE
jgi:chromosomal replication initiator protein